MKTLLLDIETFPNTGYTWGKWEQDVIEFVDHWYILSFAYKWFRQKGGVQVLALPDFPKYKPRVTRDQLIIQRLHTLLDEADVVVAHNAAKFDVRRIFTRMVQYGIKPPSSFKVIDTLKEARKFSFNSSKLDDIGRDMKLGRKVHHTGFPMWLGCHEGNAADWANMKRYNKHDVVLLDKWLTRALPWIGYLKSTGTPYAKPKAAM